MKQIIVMSMLACLLTACSTSLHSPLVGMWQSTELGGSDVGTKIESIRYAFSADGSVAIIGDVKGQPQSIQTGVYSVSNELLHIDLKDRKPQPLTYSLIEGVLTIHDPKLDAWAKFKKESAEQNAAHVFQKPRAVSENGER
jgi:hypothetical protein